MGIVSSSEHKRQDLNHHFKLCHYSIMRSQLVVIFPIPLDFSVLLLNKFLACLLLALKTFAFNKKLEQKMTTFLKKKFDTLLKLSILKASRIYMKPFFMSL